jgi:hypothetical protein
MKTLFNLALLLWLLVGFASVAFLGVGVFWAVASLL